MLIIALAAVAILVLVPAVPAWVLAVVLVALLVVQVAGPRRPASVRRVLRRAEADAKTQLSSFPDFVCKPDEIALTVCDARIARPSSGHCNLTTPGYESSERVLSAYLNLLRACRRTCRCDYCEIQTRGLLKNFRAL